MHVTAHLDIDLVALGADEEVSCLVELTAPTPPELATRAPQTVVVVLDRSGSMAGRPLAAAKHAIATLVRRLGPDDRFGLVTFDSSADIVVPAARIADVGTAGILDAVATVRPGGSTDLSAGYLMGLREAGRAAVPGGATVLVLSDGHANAGITDADLLDAVAEQAQRSVATTTATLGLGDGYDEVLLASLARGGSGEHRYAPDVDAAVAEFSGLVDDLLAKSVTGTLLRIQPQHGLVGGVRVHGALPTRAEGDAIVVNLGDLYAGEERRVLVGLRVPGLPQLGTATVADLELSYTTLPDLTVHTVTLPVSVNVVPGDVARGRVPDARVHVERLIAEVDDVKQEVATRLRVGDRDAATTSLTSTIARTRQVRDGLEASTPNVTALRERLDEVLEDLTDLAHTATTASIEQSTKLVTESWTQTARGKRRRTARADEAPSVDPEATTLVEGSEEDLA